jgi:alkaline phosphatase D
MATFKRARTKFERVQMKRMTAVGEVGPRYARIWMRSDLPGEVGVTVRPKGRTKLKKEYPLLVSDTSTDLTQTIRIDGLEPRTKYRYEVRRVAGDKLIGRGRFETYPFDEDDTPDKVSVALMSCHQPFNDDNEYSSRRARLLRVLPQVLKDHDVKFILLAGDQIYSDVPPDRSLFYRHYTKTWKYPAGESILDWGPTGVRAAYQERYRIFWAGKEVQDFYANYPCYPILDDHEIVDDWGAKEVHATNKFRQIRNGAREAYFDYQESRVMKRKKNLPPSFHYSFSYGNIGVFVLDLRSQRKAGPKGQLFSPAQLNDFETFLKSNESKKVLLVMASVPVVHLPEWLVDVGASMAGHAIDFPDHWSFKRNRLDRDRFLGLIYRHQVANPRQKVILVSGDVHIGCAFKIAWKGPGKQPVLYQFTSSAISNRMKKLQTEISESPLKLTKEMELSGGLKADTHLLSPIKDGQNPFGGLNVGLIDIDNKGDESDVTLRLVGYKEKAKSQYTYADFFVSETL